MAATQSLVDESVAVLRETSSVYAEEIGDVVINVRWLTTLVLAEIGGIAAYRKLQNVESLSMGFTLVVLILSLALLFFMASVIFAGIRRRGMETELIEAGGAFAEVVKNGNVAPVKGDEQIVTKRESTLKAFAHAPEWPTTLEMFGVGLFIGASAFGSVVLFWAEFVALF